MNFASIICLIVMIHSSFISPALWASQEEESDKMPREVIQLIQKNLSKIHFFDERVSFKKRYPSEDYSIKVSSHLHHFAIDKEGVNGLEILAFLENLYARYPEELWFRTKVLTHQNYPQLSLEKSTEYFYQLMWCLENCELHSLRYAFIQTIILPHSCFKDAHSYWKGISLKLEEILLKK